MKGLRDSYKPLEVLFKAGSRISFSKGETILHPDSKDTYIYFIKKGFVKSYDITKYGDENLLVIRKAGQVFPLLWTLTGEPADIYYQAISGVTLRRMERTKYLSFMNKSKRFNQEVLDQVLEMYKIHSQRILNLQYRTSQERVAFRLITLADRFGIKTQDGIQIKAPIRHQDIAESINCSRETASREISKLHNKCLVTTNDGFLTIKKPDELMELIGAQQVIRRRFKRFK